MNRTKMRKGCSRGALVGDASVDSGSESVVDVVVVVVEQEADVGIVEPSE